MGSSPGVASLAAGVGGVGVGFPRKGFEVCLAWVQDHSAWPARRLVQAPSSPPRTHVLGSFDACLRVHLNFFLFAALLLPAGVVLTLLLLFVMLDIICAWRQT